MRKLVVLLFAAVGIVGTSFPVLASEMNQQASAGEASAPTPPAGTEIVSRRTERTATFTTADPEALETRFYAGPMFFKDEDGTWRKIDSRLVDNGEGGVEVRANQFDLDLAPKATDDQVARFELDENHAVGFGLNGVSAGRASRSGSTQTIAGVAESTSLRLKASPSGLKFDFVLASAAAATSYVLPLTTKNLTPSIDAEGNVNFVDETGALRLSIPHGYMDDSAQTPAGQGAHSEGVTYSLVQLDGDSAGLQIDLEAAWVTDPSRVFPIVVDPDITVATDDTYVQSPHTNNFSSEPDLKVGYCAASNCNTAGGQNLKARSFMHLPNLGTLAGQTITGASLQLYQSHAYTCDTSQVVEAYRISSGTFPGNLSWSTAPVPGQLLGSKAFTPTSTCTVGWDAIPLNAEYIQNMANGVSGWANTGITIKATNETTNAGWRKFHSANQGSNPPRLSVTTLVNRQPTGSVDVVAGAQGRAHLVGWAWDPDSPGQSINVAVYFSSNGTNFDKWYLANAVRTDVPPAVPGTSNSQGFDLWIEWPAGAHTVCVYGIDTSGGPNPAIGCGSATVTAPGVPTAPRTPTAARDGNAGATVTWIKPLSDGGRSISYYTARAWTQDTTTGVWSDSGKQKTCAVTTSNPCTSAAFAGLAVGVPHAFVISAANAVGTSPTATSPVVTPATKPASPNQATAIQHSAAPTEAVVSWDIPASNGSPLTKFDVGVFEHPSGAPVGSLAKVNLPPTQSSVTVTGLDAAKSYTFVVWAYNAIGFSDGKQTNAVPTAPGQPGTPSAAILPAVFGKRTIRWDAPAHDGGRAITRYTLRATKTGASESTDLACEGQCAVDRRFEFSGEAAAGYTFSVTATNSANLTGPRSAESSALTIPPVNVFVPTDVTAARGDRHATVNWSAPELEFDELTEYEVYVFRNGVQVPGGPIPAGRADVACGTVPAPCTVVHGLAKASDIRSKYEPESEPRGRTSTAPRQRLPTR